jgi:signal transduction histidine kinase
MPAAETPVNPPPPGLLTNLLQLRTAARQTPSVVHPFRIVADVVAADSADGVLALRDASGVEFIRVDFGSRAVEPGATVCLEGTGCAVRLNSFGLEIVPGLVVNNDGTHSLASASGATFLPAGKHPLTVEWFNRFGTFGLNVDYEGPNQPRQPMPGSMLSRADVDPATGRTNFSAGLDYRCCEGLWEFLPDFEKCPPAKTGVATNFDLDVRTRDAAVGLEFRGFITIPTDGVYTFHLASDDGSRLLVGDPSVDVRVLRQQPAPAAAVRVPSGAFAGNPRPWMTLEGTVAYSSIWNAGGELQLRVGNDDLRVEVFAGDDFAPALPAHGRVRVSGVYEDVLTEAGARVPGRLRVLNWKAVRPAGGLETAPAKAIGDGAMTPPPAGGVPAAPVAAPLSTAAEIKALSSDLAGRQLPVSMRGVVTVYASKVDGAVVQDSTRGVFVDLHEMGEAEPLQRNELCQIEGVTGPGLFAPVVVARRISHLGPGQLPQPLHASWDQLLNGSLDTEYAEIDGVVTALRDHQVVLLMQGGKMALDLRDLRPESLLGYEGAVVRIRGCPLANFDLETHRLEPGPLVVRGAAIEVLQPAPRDLFEAPHKRIGELMLYDPKAAPFRLLKVNGQIIGGRPGEYFLTDGTNGLRVIMKNSAAFAVGELVDTVGFLELGGPAAELREAVMRRTGSAPLRPPIKVASDRLLQAGCADMRVRVAATLMNQWREGSDCLLELQSGFLAFKARINCDGREVSLPPPGSRLELTGVYVPQGNRAGDGTVSGFELLLPSPAGIRVLASPPWTLKRLLVLGGILAMLLCVVLIWNKQLQQQVQERTRKLELEIRGRQWAELQQAAEAERARIARDLHDDLGTGLTEVSLLASVGLGQFEDGEKIRQRFDTIAEKARALVSGLDVIVWAIDPQRNSLQSFADYLGGYAKELLSSSAIVCRLRIRMECGGVALTEAARHSLFLAVKEALNNVIRHASASAVEIQISQLNHHLHIAITDNGRGFDGHLIQRGRGLTNLEERLQAMRGECRIESQPGGGTTVKFKVALTPATQVDAPA